MEFATDQIYTSHHIRFCMLKLYTLQIAQHFL